MAKGGTVEKGTTILFPFGSRTGTMCAENSRGLGTWGGGAGLKKTMDAKKWKKFSKRKRVKKDQGGGG